MPATTTSHLSALAALIAIIATGCADVRAPRSAWGTAPGDDPPADAEDARSETDSSDEGVESDDAKEPDANDASFREPVSDLGAKAPASRYANLSDPECARELARRQLAFAPSKEAADGVDGPLRIAGPLHGVRFVTPAAPSPFGIVDCRLALALGDLAELLATFDVVEVRIDNFFRKNATLPPRGKKAKKKVKSSQHALALAADITSLRLKDGALLAVPSDWHASIGSVSCGPDASMTSPDASSVALRNIVCEVARRGIFHHMLTPSYDAAHQSHFHFDIKRGASRTVVH